MANKILKELVLPGSDDVYQITPEGIGALPDTLKNDYDAAYEHSKDDHARTDATKVGGSTENGNILINDVETNVYTHPVSAVVAGTYKSVTVDEQGHITAGTNPTTLDGYGITDAAPLSHTTDLNPHCITKSTVGLDNVTNDAQVKRSEMGAADGVAVLGSDGKVLTSQLPSYVDDVLEYSEVSSFPVTGEAAKIYVDTTTNKTYRWGGTTYVEISASLALGETSSTAYAGDKGKIAYEHSQTTSGNPHSVTAEQVGAYTKTETDSAIAAYFDGRVFIGTKAQYDTADAAGSIAVGTLVFLTDDENVAAGGATTAILGQAILGQMILG